MNNLQKGSILMLLKTDKMNSSYTNNYWFSYKDYLDPKDDFTDFCCECLEGKYEYIALIENLINKDKTAKIFVQVYGLEDEDKVITADIIILLSENICKRLTPNTTPHIIYIDRWRYPECQSGINY